jgi:hypothetical protein
MPARDYSEEEGNPAATQADHGHLDTIEAADNVRQSLGARAGLVQVPDGGPQEA